MCATVTSKSGHTKITSHFPARISGRPCALTLSGAVLTVSPGGRTEASGRPWEVLVIILREYGRKPVPERYSPGLWAQGVSNTWAEWIPEWYYSPNFWWLKSFIISAMFVCCVDVRGVGLRSRWAGFGTRSTARRVSHLQGEDWEAGNLINFSHWALERLSSVMFSQLPLLSLSKFKIF